MGGVCWDSSVGEAALEFNTFLLSLQQQIFLTMLVQELPKCLFLLIVFKNKTKPSNNNIQLSAVYLGSLERL